MLAVSYLVRGLALAAVLMPLAVACGGTVEHVSDEEDGSGGRSSGGALATGIGTRGTLLTVGVLGLLLAAGAVLWSPVRRHQTLPAAIAD